MRKLIYLLSILLFAASINAQTLLSEDFSSKKMAPDGWTIEGKKENWRIGESSNAGGDKPEGVFYYEPAGNGTFRLISPKIDTKNKSVIKLSFKQYFQKWGTNAYKFGVATKSGSSDWKSVWELQTQSADIAKETKFLDIKDNLNTTDFQFCFYFIGDPDDIGVWNIDDIKLFVPSNKDAKIEKVTIDSHYKANTSFAPKITVKNNGLEKSSFPATVEIWQSTNKLYTKTEEIKDLDANATKEITLAEFKPEKSNELYKVISFTNLDGDGEKTNDSLVVYFNTNEFQKLVVWENFTNTGCGPCAAANPTNEKVIKANIDKVLPIFVHVSWPDGNDPYYTPIKTKLDARTKYYNIQGVPTVVLNGKTTSASGEAKLNEAVQVGAKEFSPLKLTLKGQISGEKYLSNIEIDVVGGVSPDKYTLHVGITETNLDFNAPNGEKHFLWVLRDLYPSETGTPLTLTKGVKITKTIECPINSSWKKENLDLFVYVQNEKTKEIVQAAKILNITDVEELENSIPTDFVLEQNYPNPFNPSTVIKYSVKETSKIKISVYDLLGREVKTLVNEEKETGNYEVIFNAENLASGVYLYKITAGKYVDVKKMILVK